ncbi:MAG TPA: hypothetical protein P5025_09405, partial [Candidatus Ratteibacteria bacterium]|nr:hypothetical protein [Candidatus Ratteibacteria bacterium]
GQDYTSLYNTIKSADSWWHYLESTWLIKTNQNPSAWTDKIKRVIDPNDYLFVVDISGKSYNGWLPQKAWDWINQNK